MNYFEKYEDENGVYITNNSDDGVDYVNDILGKFSSKGKCEYVGDYCYALGKYLLYKFV